MPAKTKVMPSAYFLSPYQYSKEQAEELLEILRPHLLPAYHNGQQDDWIVMEIQKAVGILSQSQKSGWPTRNAFTLRKLKQLQAAYGKYAELVQQIDEESLGKIELELMDGGSSSQYIQAETQQLGFNTSNPLLMGDVVRHVLAVNDHLMMILDMLRDQDRKHRPQDSIMRHTVFHLYVLYERVTGKKAAVGGILQEFMEAAIAPIVPSTKRKLTSYLRELQQQFAPTEGNSAKNG